MAALTPSKIGSSRDKCVLCSFSFLEPFVNDKGKLAAGSSRKRIINDVSKLTFYSKETSFECPTSICAICLTLLDKGIKAHSTYQNVSAEVINKLAQLPRKRVPVFSPCKRPTFPKRSDTKTRLEECQYTHVGLSPKIVVKKKIVIPPLSMSNSTVSNRPAAKPGTTGIGGSLKENKFPKVRRSLSPQMNIKAGDPPLVQITLTYPSRTVKRQVENPKIQNLVKAVANDQMRSASRAMTAIDLPGVLQEVCKVIEKEVNLLTSLKVNSMLRRTTKEDFSQFSFQKLFLELKTNAPCLVQLACAAMNFNIHCVDEKEQARVCCTLSPMLKTRNKEMSAMAYLTSFVLKHGGCKQQDFERVARMGYSVTPRAAARKLQLISCSMDSDYDEILAAWKSNSKVEKVVTSLWEILHARIVLPKPILDMLIDANLVEVVLTNEFSSDIHTLSELIKNGFPLDVSSYPYTVEMESTRNYLNKKFLEATTAETPRISIAGDNWDKRIIPTYISSESQGEDLHLFMLVLLVDRVSTPSNLASTTPQKKVSDMNNEDLLPNESEQVLLRSELSFIVGKCGVSHIPALEKLFAHIMPKTYPHLLQGIFSQKSKQSFQAKGFMCWDCLT